MWAGSDRSLKTHERLETGPEGPTHTDLERALAEVRPDAVIVNTPSHLHYDQVASALRACAHVLVAKPVTNDSPTTSTRPCGSPTSPVNWG